LNNIGKNLAMWVLIGGLLVALYSLFQGSSTREAGSKLTYSEFVAQVERGEVRSAVIQGQIISGVTTSGRRFTVNNPNDPQLVDRLIKNKVDVSSVPPDRGMHPLLSAIISWLPILLIVGVWIFFMRQMQNGTGRAMGFGKSRAKLLTERQGRVTFEDVAGVDEAKVEVGEIVDFLRDPQKFTRLGGKIPKGVLLVGPPGTGKTLLARAIAGEANVPFFTISGSDFVEMFVGVGASRVRDMFEQGKKNAPCIIFIDEIDAVGRHRGAGLGGGNDEREQTLNQLLVEMDGFDANEGVIIIAATNRPDVLDPALLRPGRFDRQVVVPNPDVAGREKILKVHMKRVPLAPDVDAAVLARGTPGFSGADLANLVNEAALMAARRNKRMVAMADFEAAKDKVMMGAERRSMVMTDEEKMMTAYHEAGHAIVGLVVPGSDPLHKVTIIPRGRALGVTMSLPERDRLTMTKEWMEAKIAVAFGGRIAEKLIYGENHMNSGAASDIRMATDLARTMVTQYGMSEKLGPLMYTENQDEVFLGYSISQRKTLSDETAKLIDEEIRHFVEAGETKAREVLAARLDHLHAIAKALVEFETLSGDEVQALMRGEAIARPKQDEPPPKGSAPATGAAAKKPARGSVPSSRPKSAGPAPEAT
jgi:cell division protease FtsH